MKYISISISISIPIFYILFLGCSDKYSDSSDVERSQGKSEEVSAEIVIEEDKYKNVIVKPKGSQILQKSYKCYRFYGGTGFWLSSVDLTDCEEPGYDKNYSEYQIKYVKSTDSTMEISFSFLAKCGSDFLFEVELIDEDVLNILYHGYRSLADCNCEYSAKYLLVDRDYLEGLEMDNVKLKRISVNNGRKELISNYFDDN